MPAPPGAQAAKARATKRKSSTTERWVASGEATVTVSEQRTVAVGANGDATAVPHETAAALESAFDEQPTQRVKTDKLPGDVDAAIDRLLDPGGAHAEDALRAEAERVAAADRRAAAETFGALLAAGMAQVRELMAQLPVGRTPRHWAASCRPVIAPFLEGARQIELVELSSALEQLDAALERAAGEVGAYVGPETCSAIARAYAELASQLPHEFVLPSQGDGRRMLVLESLLLQVPSLHRRTLNKLYGASLGSFEQLSGASADEIAAVAGIDASVAEAIVERVRRFERERSQQSPLELRSRALDRLRAALARLGQHQEQFERAELEDAAERKRAARRARESAARELELLLSEIGELPLIEELKRCGVRNKIRRVESYLERAHSAS
jgi:hypothetical protein